MLRALGIPAVFAFAALAHVLAPAHEDKPLRELANGFVSALEPAQRGKAMFAVGAPERFDWAFVPREGFGVALGEMNGAQRRAAWALVRELMSERGARKIEGVLELETLLRELESTPQQVATWRDAGLYRLAVFGDPAEKGAEWGLRFEGHHLSLNVACADGRIHGLTPAFFGTNPARADRGERGELRVLAAEEDLARELLASLDDDQRALAVLRRDLPGDVLFGPGRENVFAEPAGLAAARMSPAQRETLLRLIGEYVGNYSAPIAEAELARIRAAGLERIHFAWIGGRERNEPHYYRVHGPHFVIEYDNSRPGANHVHSLWRDFERDFGEVARPAHRDAEK